MKCIICNGHTAFYFKKKWELPFKVFLDEAEFYKCDNCGFTYSKTLFEMEQSKWELLNQQFHTHIENPQNLKQGNQPPYIEQATMLNLLKINKIIDTKSIIDYGGGLGTIEKILQKYFNMNMPIHDPFMQNNMEQDLIYLNESGIYKTVYCSALFEHIIKRDTIETINNFVADDGVLILHTVICENIPKDPNWFYINPPVHSALHTNKSMSILMEQLNYVSSLYCPTSKCWVLYKKEPSDLLKGVSQINAELQNDYIYYKKGFVDYWKGF